MPVKTGRLAEFRRALNRVDPTLRHDFKADEHISSARDLPPELAEQLRGTDTEDLLEILRGDDSLGLMREVHRFVSDLVRMRVGSDDFDDEKESFVDPEREVDYAEQEDEEFFVGWVAGEEGQTIEMVNHVYQPSNRAHVSHETLQRYRQRTLAGGLLGKLDNKADLAEAVRIQRQNDKWKTRSVQRVGEVAADELSAALRAVMTAQLKEILETRGNESVTLGLEGRNAVLFTADGKITKLSRVATKHLALVGLLPRHWFLPLMWWKRMQAEEEAQLADKGRSKKRIYKGRYDDDDVQSEMEEEKGR